MFKYLVAAASMAVLFVATEASSQAGPRRCGGSVASPAYQTAAVSNGYRTYSYQPGTSSSGVTVRSSSGRPSFFDAGSKALGRYGK